MYVIDASVLVADARPSEPSHSEAHTLLIHLRTEEGVVYLPTIVLAEVAAAISRGTGDSSVAERWVTRLEQLSLFHFVSVDKKLGQLAAKVAAEYQTRGCDAVYVTLAKQHGVTLITLNRQQRERVPDDLVARTPAEELADLGL
jgi:predicted nucleic acid-binding protein